MVAIRERDQRHLVTIGAIPWAITWPTAKPGIEACTNLDFLSLHFYPRKGKVEKALNALAVCDLGKPIVIEEIFPLNCSVADLDQFIEGSQPLATGWLGFYWGRTIAEYRREKGSIGDAMTREWLEYFQRKTPEIMRPRSTDSGKGA